MAAMQAVLSQPLGFRMLRGSFVSFDLSFRLGFQSCEP